MHCSHDHFTSEGGEDAVFVSCGYASDNVVDEVGREFDLDEERKVGQVRFRSALKWAKKIYPNQLSGFSDKSWWEVVSMTIRLTAAGHSIPAAALAARKVEFDLEQAAVAQAAVADARLHA